MNGAVPAALGTLLSLDTLNLSRNDLGGELPLEVARLGATAQACHLAGNANLCIPDTAEYRGLGVDPICQIPLSATCSEPAFVGLVGLVAEPIGHGIRVSWTVNGSAVHLRFDVEQLVAGIPVVLGSIPGRAENPGVYSYEVRDLAAGTHVFQVRQIDQSGSTLISSPVVFELQAPGIMVEAPYPNPFHTSTVLHLVAGSEVSVTVDLFSVDGRLLRTLFDGIPPRHQRTALHLAAEGLPSGAYLVRVSMDGIRHSIHPVHVVR